MSVNTISIAEVAELLARGNPLDLLDVRTPAEFERIHAVGARLMPLDQLDPSGIIARRSDVQQPIYVICQSGARAAKACERLGQAGVANVFCIEGGTAAWQGMGLPVERGANKVISLERQVRIAAGALVMLGLILAWTIQPAFAALSAFVACGLIFAGVTDTCGMAMVLGKMPWNRSRQDRSIMSSATR
jgi:rhodanese-related sulfurtransferase